MFSTKAAFAAMKDDSSVVAWGDSQYGGRSSVSSALSSQVANVFANLHAFVALKFDLSVVTWGSHSYEGSISSSTAVLLDSNVIWVVGSETAFAALTNDGSVVTWGNNTGGELTVGQSNALNGSVSAVYTNGHAFAALKVNGSLVIWGQGTNGGSDFVSEDDLVYASVSGSNAYNGNSTVLEHPDSCDAEKAWLCLNLVIQYRRNDNITSR